VPVAVISWKIENGGFRGAGDRIGMLVGLGLGLTKPSQQSALWNAVFQALARTLKLCVCVLVCIYAGGDLRAKIKEEWLTIYEDVFGNFKKKLKEIGEAHIYKNS